MSTSLQVQKDRTFFQKIGGRSVAIRGYSTDALFKHLADHNDNKSNEKRWCNPSCLAKTFGERDSKESRQKARSRFSSGYTRLLTRGKLLLKEYRQVGGYLDRVKLYDSVFPEDREFASRQFDQAVERGDESHGRLEQFAHIIGIEYEPVENAPLGDQPSAGSPV